MQIGSCFLSGTNLSAFLAAKELTAFLKWAQDAFERSLKVPSYQDLKVYVLYQDEINKGQYMKHLYVWQ